MASYNTDHSKSHIGYQVTREGENGIELHPNMNASFCVYSLGQCVHMLNNGISAGYGVTPVMDGDIQEPTIMFNGTPNQ